MQNISDQGIDTELRILHEGFAAVLQGAPPTIRSISESLLERLELKRHATSAKWIHQFSPLTVLYPLLQAEGVDCVSRAEARSATVAHLCLLISTFAQDRHEDGQVKLRQEELTFSEYLLHRGLQQLRELKRAKPALSQFELEAGSFFARISSETRTEGTLRYIAPKKAYLGYVATNVLLHCGGVSIQHRRRAADAFDYLAIALQYADDAEDWRDDLALNDDNLLLARLRDRGLDSYFLPANEFRTANVGHALLRHDSLGHAGREAKFFLDQAETIQSELECPTLVSLLRRLRSDVEAALVRLRNRIETEIIAACLIAGTAVPR